MENTSFEVENLPKVRVDTIGIYLTLTDNEDICNRMRNLDKLTGGDVTLAQLDEVLKSNRLFFAEGKMLHNYILENSYPTGHPDLIALVESGSTGHTIYTEENKPIGSIYLSRV
jgi:hypothetical protein